MNCPYNVKVCTVCKRILIANSMNFPKDKKGKHGFSSRCSECNKEHKRKWYKNNKESEIYLCSTQILLNYKRIQTEIL